MSDVKSYPTEEVDEPLLSISDVVGIEAPEPLEDVTTPEDNDVSSLSPYEKWRLHRDADSLYEVTKSLRPTIDSVVASLGGTGNPQIAAKARVIAAKAVQAYDPSMGATLPTWVSQQLRQLTRDIRKSNNMVHVPDGVQMDAYALYRAEKEFEDEHGREPTVEELADISHLSVKRIKDVRTKMRPIVTDAGTESEDGSSLLSMENSDYTQDALDYVYAESDRNDKKILEYTVGYGGTTPLDPKQIMQKLKLTPVQFSRRKARLSMRINEIVDGLSSV
jgi:DNA-directed RNA polymerase specialized sigma subunit